MESLEEKVLRYAINVVGVVLVVLAILCVVLPSERCPYGTRVATYHRDDGTAYEVEACDYSAYSKALGNR
jgi:hypothetical protein